MGTFKAGDKVEIIKITFVDQQCNIRLTDVAKITAIDEVDEGWFYCTNPNWTCSNILMKHNQLKKL